MNGGSFTERSRCGSSMMSQMSNRLYVCTNIKQGAVVVGLAASLPM